MPETHLNPFIEHPEGGRYCEVFKSTKSVIRADGDSRSALTHIYFSLDPGEISLFHKVSSDEVWNLYQGAGIHLHIWDGSHQPPTSVTLSQQSGRFCHVIPAGMWQAAEPISDTVLLGCSVAPGFEFCDFQIMDDESELAYLIHHHHPAFAKFTGPARLVQGPVPGSS